jgi:hypothetical protein
MVTQSGTELRWVRWKTDPRPIETLGLPPYLESLLAQDGVNTIGQLVSYLRCRLERVYQIGPERRAVIADKLGDFMRQESERYQPRNVTVSGSVRRVSRGRNRVVVLPDEMFARLGGDYIEGCQVTVNGEPETALAWGEPFSTDQDHSYRYLYLKG